MTGSLSRFVIGDGEVSIRPFISSRFTLRSSLYNANRRRRLIPLDSLFAMDPSVHVRLSRRMKMQNESTDNAIGQRVIPLSILQLRGRFDLSVHTFCKQGIRRRPTLLSMLRLRRETRSVVCTPTNNAIDGKWIIFLVLHR